MAPAGRVRVGQAGEPGGLIEAAPASATAAAGPGSAAEISFLKEQQWQIPFATALPQNKALARELNVPIVITPHRFRTKRQFWS